jgi:hypothetical protein
MLITFHSKAAAEVMMFREHAKPILDLLHKDEHRGVITAAEAPHAIACIEKEIAESRLHPVSNEMQRDVHAHHGAEADDPEHEEVQVVSFATRVFPLLEMLRAASRNGDDVLWGV